MEDNKYTCPKCGTVYDIAPKWCTCEPYPMEIPSASYLLIENGLKPWDVIERELNEKEYELLLATLDGKAEKEMLSNIGESNPDLAYYLDCVTCEPGVETLDTYTHEFVALSEEEHTRMVSILNAIREENGT